MSCLTDSRCWFAASLISWSVSNLVWAQPTFKTIHESYDHSIYELRLQGEKKYSKLLAVPENTNLKISILEKIPFKNNATADNSSFTLKHSKPTYLGPIKASFLQYEASDEVSFSGSLIINVQYIKPKKQLHDFSPININNISQHQVDFYHALGMEKFALPRAKSAKRFAYALVLSHSSLRTPLRSWMRDQEEKGRYFVNFEIDGLSAEKIKLIIAKQFKKDPAPEVCILVGDTSKLPTFIDENGLASDDFYAFLDEGHLPDLILTRMNEFPKNHNANTLRFLGTQKEILNIESLPSQIESFGRYTIALKIKYLEMAMGIRSNFPDQYPYIMIGDPYFVKEKS